MNTVQSPDTLKKYIKWLRNAVDKGHLYDEEEYYKIKQELRKALIVREQLQAVEKRSRGFGYEIPKVVVDTTPDDVVESVDPEIVEDVIDE